MSLRIPRSTNRLESIDDQPAVQHLYSCATKTRRIRDGSNETHPRFVPNCGLQRAAICWRNHVCGSLGRSEMTHVSSHAAPVMPESLAAKPAMT